jgi:hypothetical protein
MSYLALALSSNVAVSSCRAEPEAAPQGYRDIEPMILETAPAHAEDTSAPLAAAPVLLTIAPPIETSLAALRTPGEDHFGYCAAGLTRTGQARRDLTRLGGLCGPSNGLLAFEPAFQLVASPTAVVRKLALNRGQCVRIAVATEQAEERVEVQLRGVKGDQPVQCSVGFGWCPPSGVFCGGLQTELELRTTNGEVEVQARLWAMQRR